MRTNRGFGPWPDEELKLDGGAWRLDPFTRIVRWVPNDPTVKAPDSFDEPLEGGRKDRGGRSRKPVEHGTYRGARQHYRRHEKLCRACRIAEYEYSANRARNRWEQGDPVFTCECGAFKAKRASAHCPSCAQTLRNARERAAA